MKEEHYYIPSIEEFYIGFEFEQLLDDNDLLYQWETTTLETVGYLEDIEDDLKYRCGTNIRVKYLCKEDIESLGLKYNSWSTDSDYEIYNNERYNLFIYKNNLIQITDNFKATKHDSLYFHFNLFYGTIKNKSELKQILKQLQIN